MLCASLPSCVAHNKTEPAQAHLVQPVPPHPLPAKAHDDMGGPTAPLAPYVDPDSGLLVQQLSADAGLQLVDSLTCLVHLLPQFRISALNKFAAGAEQDVHLSGCCPSTAGSNAPRTGMVLYRCVKTRNHN